MGAEVVDVAGVARILGLTRGAVVDHVARGVSRFPAPVTSSAAGPCWSPQVVHEWGARQPKSESTLDPGWLPSPGRWSAAVWELANLAGQEAAGLNHGSVLPMHLLLGALSPDCPGAAYAILGSFGVTADAARREYTSSLGDPFAQSSDSIRFTPLAQVVLERANVYAVVLADEETGGEHVLLALLQYWESAGLIPGILARFQVDSASVHNRILAMSFDGVAGFAVSRYESPPRDPAPKEGSEALWPETPKLRLTPDGRDPRRRKPWAEATEKGHDRPGVEGRETVHYLVDRDRNPILTAEGDRITLLYDDDGQLVRDASGKGAIGTVRAE